MKLERTYSNNQNYRKWEKVVETLVKYDRDSSEMGYPLTFFYQLEQYISAGRPLSLNIATTLTGAKDNCLKTVFEKDEQIGKVVYIPAILKSTFDVDIEKQMQERLAKFCERDIKFAAFYNNLKQTNTCDQMLPWAIIKEKEGNRCRVITHSKDEYKKIVNLQAHQVAQCFIWGSGKQTSIIRFFYFPTKQNSEAYKIDNLQGFMKKRYGKGQFKVRQRSQNSLTFVKIMYTNKSFYKQTLSLVQFLQKHQKIKISKIVTDWILDPHNRYYLIDVKELTYTKAEALVKTKRSLSDALAYISCAVCQQKFRQEQITKTLTGRLISQFFEHLKKRQIQLSFIPSSKHNADLSRLCQQCYMLVVSQSELMELQKQIATITHSIKPNQSLSSNPILTGSKGELFQWRLFFYLEDIKDLNIQNFDSKTSYYIMIRIHNSITSLKLNNPNDKYQLIKAIKVHYLFSQSQKIDKFLNNSEIVIRITKGNNWNSVLAEGSTSGLYEESQKHSMRKFKQILVFNQNSKYSVVGIHIGIKMEGKYDPFHLALQKTYDVYMVQDGYSNCYALPAQWMQTIDPSYCISKSEQTSFNYSLHLAASQKKALFPNLNKNRKRLVL